MPIRVLALLTSLFVLAFAGSASAAPKKAQLRFSATTYSVAENAGGFDVKVLRSGALNATTTVSLSVDAASTAVNGADYTLPSAPPITVSFAPGSTSQTVRVTVLDNQTANAPNKKIVFKLSGASGGAQIKTTTATLTIIDNEGPGTLDFSAPTYSVVEGAGVATLTVNRIGASNLRLSVQYTTQNASTSPATPVTDYTAIGAFPAQTLVFEPGEVTKTLQVLVTDDAMGESDENVNVVLSNPQNLTTPAQVPQIGPNSPAVLTIKDDDVSSFRFDSTIFSASEGDGSATITVDRTGATNLAASVNYSASNGTAGAGDYTLLPGTLQFAAYETSKTFDVAITDDATDEPNETVNLTLTSGVTAVDTSTLSIVDNDQPIESVQFSDTSYSVNEAVADDATPANRVARVTLTLSHALAGDVSVKFTSTDGTATAAQDYTAATNQTVTFTAGQTSQTVEVPILSDTVAEDPETINLALSSPTGTNLALGAPSTATLTIVDDDPTGDVEFAALSYEVDETDGNALVTVRRVGGAAGAVSVDYATSDGTAQAGSDYTAASGALDFAAGQTQASFSIPLTWDGLDESTETINVALSNPAGGADLAANDAAVVHVGDDGASGPVQFSAANFSVGESDGSVMVSVTRSGGSLGGPVSVDYATSDGSATAGDDYTATTGTLSFAAGETTKAFSVAVLGDSAQENPESFTVSLSNPTGGTVLGPTDSASVAIADDDAGGGASPGGGTGSGGGGTSPVPSTQSSPSNPTGSGSQTAATDKVAPKVTLTAKAVQKALKLKLLKLVASCDENCKLTVVAKTGKGRKAIKLGKAGGAVARGVKQNLKIKLSKKALGKLVKAMKSGKVKVAITVTATDGAGNKGKATRTVTVKR